MGATERRSVSLVGPLPCRLLLPPISVSSSEFGSLVCPDLFKDDALTPGPLHDKIVLSYDKKNIKEKCP